MDRKIRLPKDAFIDEQDVEGHARSRLQDDQPGPQAQGQDDFKSRVEDTEGHIGGRPGSPDDLTVLPAPPSLGLRRTPGHGGELTDDAEDVEGHKISR